MRPWWRAEQMQGPTREHAVWQPGAARRLCRHAWGRDWWRGPGRRENWTVRGSMGRAIEYFACRAVQQVDGYAMADGSSRTSPRCTAPEGHAQRPASAWSWCRKRARPACSMSTCARTLHLAPESRWQDQGIARAVFGDWRATWRDRLMAGRTAMRPWTHGGGLAGRCHQLQHDAWRLQRLKGWRWYECSPYPARRAGARPSARGVNVGHRCLQKLKSRWRPSAVPAGADGHHPIPFSTRTRRVATWGSTAPTTGVRHPA